MVKHLKLFIAIASCLVLAGLVTAGARASGQDGPTSTSASSVLSAVRSHASELGERLGITEDESQVAPGTLDDGRELLPQAQITIDQAIEAAKAARSGSIGEIDLEHFDGRLVFNVDVGDKDVKVDATDGTVLGSESED
jgi:uncharacterized membrane protein YkoI